MKGIFRFKVTPKRLAVTFPNGTFTYSSPRRVVLTEEYQGVYLVPDVGGYQTDGPGLLQQLQDWIDRGYKQP